MANTYQNKIEALQIWKEGLQTLDIEKIQQALNAGIAPDTYVDQKHPLHHIINSQSASGSARIKRNRQITFSLVQAMDAESNAMTPSSDTPKSSKIKIINLLVDHGLSLLAPIKDKKQKVIDTLLEDPDRILLSSIVSIGIRQSLEQDPKAPYSFDLDGILEDMTPDKDASPSETEQCKELFLEKLKTLKEIHGYVSIALDDTTIEEEPVFANNREALSFWRTPFKGPDNDTINAAFPIDDEALKKEKKAQFLPSLFGFGGQQQEENEHTITLKPENPEDIMKELGQYTGIESFKSNMHALILSVQFNKARLASGLKTDVQNYHTAFLGNPGTGKTTCSRLKARLLHSLGLTGPRYTELSRDSIISKYHGNTEGKVKNIIDGSDIIFIDEAYALVDGQGNRHDYGYRAVDTLVSAMGNRKDAFTLFVAGYKEPMERFLSANEGLSSRIKVFENMRDFTMPELGEILTNNLTLQQYTMDQNVMDYTLRGIETEKRKQGGQNFGNARVVVSLIQEIPNQMAYRLGKESGGCFTQFNKEALSTITIADVEKALETRGIEVPQNPFKSIEKKPKIATTKPEQKIIQGPWMG